MEYKTLEEVKTLLDLNNNHYGPVCHLCGYFIEAERSKSDSEFWILGDATRMHGIKIKLKPPIEHYPIARPGDIVRIHRLSINQAIRIPYVASPKNVVVWPSFKEKTTPYTTARNPTLTNEDEPRRKQLEALYCSTISQINELNNHRNSVFLLKTAGKVEAKEVDRFGHILLTLNDGTATIIARIFHESATNRFMFETNEHFQTASSLQVGNYVFIGGLKLDPKNNYLNLSANSAAGRCLRIVERCSILGSRIADSMGDHIKSDPPEIIAQRPRRSPRFQKDVQSGTSLDPIEILSSQSQSQKSSQPPSSESQLSQTQEVLIEPDPMPRHTRLGDISMKTTGYNYYDIIGQVRSAPNEARYYGNWVLQIYDGSQLLYGSYFVEDVKEPVQNCATVLVYSKQKESDTDKHIEIVKKVKDGDLIMIKNVKASWRNDLLKLEMNANLQHGKSIEMIDKESSFGRRLLEIVTNPIVEELIDDPDRSSFLLNSSIDETPDGSNQTHHCDSILHQTSDL